MTKNIPFIRKRHKLDATDLALGRLAVQIAILLRGKHKTTFEPHKDEGDIVEVINVSKMKFSGKKMEQKVYHHYSGYPGGLKTKKLAELFSKRPDEVLRRAVHEMLPDNRLRAAMIRRLIIK
jgi:large subunit ribosomal protein L13